MKCFNGWSPLKMYTNDAGEDLLGIRHSFKYLFFIYFFQYFKRAYKTTISFKYTFTDDDLDICPEKKTVVEIIENPSTPLKVASEHSQSFSAGDFNVSLL